jgi:REP element-mobilizing transposase RayT
MSTYSQIYIQIVFAVKGRESFIKPEWEERLHQYIAGFIRNKQQKLIAINGTSNHIHILIGMTPTCCLSDLVRELKKASNSFVNEHKLCSYIFRWQEGFGAFSYSRSQIDNVVKYVLDQKKHHAKKTFKDEFLEFLQKFEITYDKKYLPNWED